MVLFDSQEKAHSSKFLILCFKENNKSTDLEKHERENYSIFVFQFHDC